MNDRIIWAAPLGYEPFQYHAIKHVDTDDNGSVQTWCDGRWPKNETGPLDVNPAASDRCKRCDVVVFGNQVLERGG